MLALRNNKKSASNIAQPTCQENLAISSPSVCLGITFTTFKAGDSSLHSMSSSVAWLLSVVSAMWQAKTKYPVKYASNISAAAGTLSTATGGARCKLPKQQLGNINHRAWLITPLPHWLIDFRLPYHFQHVGRIQLNGCKRYGNWFGNCQYITEQEIGLSSMATHNSQPTICDLLYYTEES